MLQSTSTFHKSVLESQSFFSLTVKKYFIVTVSTFQVTVPRNLSLELVSLFNTDTKIIFACCKRMHLEHKD